MKNSLGFIIRDKFDVEFNNVSMKHNVCISADSLLSHVPECIPDYYWGGIIPDKQLLIEICSNSTKPNSSWKFYFLSLEDMTDFEVLWEFGASGDASLELDMLSDIRPDDVLTKFCGLEVLDSCFTSAHYRWGFGERYEAISKKFSPFLLENGLFKNFESALAFRRICDVVVKEHSPFIVVRIEELLFQNGDLFPQAK